MIIFQFMPIPALFEILSLYASGVQTYILRPRSADYRWWRVQKLSFCTRRRFIQARKMAQSSTLSLWAIEKHQFCGLKTIVYAILMSYPQKLLESRIILP